MLALEPFLNHIGPFLMVLARLSGLFLFAPVLASSIIPARVRLLLVLVLSLAVYPTIPPAQQAPIHLDLFSLIPAMFAETLIGLVIGLIAALPMYAVQLGGQIIGQQVGLGLGQIYNPGLETESDMIGQLLLYMAMVIFMSLGGLDMLFLGLARTFANVPVGTASIHLAPAELFTGMVSSGFELAFRVAAPVLCIILVETIATAFIMKTMPQLNIMSIGFAVKVVLALIALIASVAVTEQVMGEDVAATCNRLLHWCSTLGTPTPAP